MWHPEDPRLYITPNHGDDWAAEIEQGTGDMVPGDHMLIIRGGNEWSRAEERLGLSVDAAEDLIRELTTAIERIKSAQADRKAQIERSRREMVIDRILGDYALDDMDIDVRRAMRDAFDAGINHKPTE